MEGGYKRSEAEAKAFADAEERWKKFQNRVIPQRLTVDLIGTAPDDELEQLILDFVGTKLPDELDVNDYSWLTSLPSALQVVWASIVVEGDVMNGGFNQLFFNWTSAFADAAVSGFENFGASAAAAIIREANVRAESDKEDIIKSWGDGSMESFMGSYRDERFRDLDDRFYALYQTDDPTPLRRAFIRSHATEIASD